MDISVPPASDPDFLPLTNDLVFKVLFERHPDLLSAMLSAVLGEEVIVEAVLNAGIPGDGVADKLMVLDLRVRLRDGSRAFVEIQAVAAPYSEERFFAYLCREYSSQLGRGQPYAELTPTIGVIWYARTPEPRYGFHETFRFRGDRTGQAYGSAVTLHVLQLGLLPAGSCRPETRAERSVRIWGMLLAAKSQRDLDALVEEEPAMNDAVEQLRTLSKDPEVVRLARQRAEAEFFHELGVRKIQEEAEARGEARGRSDAVLKLIMLKFGVIDPIRERKVREASLDELDRFTERALTAASADEVFDIG